MPPLGDMNGGLARMTSAYSFQRSSLVRVSYSRISGATKPCRYMLTNDSLTMSGEMSYPLKLVASCPLSSGVNALWPSSPLLADRDVLVGRY